MIAMQPAFAFVGEKRSQRAIAMGVKWTDGRLAAKTLHAALRHVGLSPERQVFVNIFADGPGYEVVPGSLALIRELEGNGYTVIALGNRVQRALESAGVQYRAMVHPAARGSIRKTERYQAHVGHVLQAVL